MLKFMNSLRKHLKFYRMQSYGQRYEHAKLRAKVRACKGTSKGTSMQSYEQSYEHAMLRAKVRACKVTSRLFFSWVKEEGRKASNSIRTNYWYSWNNVLKFATNTFRHIFSKRIDIIRSFYQAQILDIWPWVILGIIDRLILLLLQHSYCLSALSIFQRIE